MGEDRRGDSDEWDEDEWDKSDEAALDLVSDGPQAFGDSAGFVMLAPLLAGVIAAFLGWVAVPNSLVPYETAESHRGLAAGAALAAFICAALLAPSAYRRPVRTAVLMFLGVYFGGFAALNALGVPYERLGGFGGFSPIDASGFFAALLPWIVTGTFLWSAGIWALGSLGAPIESRSTPSPQEKMVPLALVLVAVLVTGIVVVAPGSLRRIGWTVPEAPAAHRPTVVGVVSADPASSGRVRLEGGSEVELPRASLSGAEPTPPPGVLLLVGGGEKPWYTFLQPDDGVRACKGAGRHWHGPNRGEVAWDRDGWILFPNGLELPITSSFSALDPPVRLFADLVYPANGWHEYCISERGEVEAGGSYGGPM